MSGTITLAGAAVLRGRVSLPIRGAWWADLAADTATAPSGQVQLEAQGGLSLRGTVTAAVDNDTLYARLVGGAGGLDRVVAGAYQGAFVRDVLDAVARQAGEALAGTIPAALLTIRLDRWTLGSCTARRALDELAATAAARLGAAVNWRFLGDGSLWMGTESWPTSRLPDTAVVVGVHPAERRMVLGVEAPALLPGVDLADFGRVVAVDHWIAPGALRSWAWRS